MATAPTPGAARRAELEEVTITVKVDGESHTFRPAEVDAVMASKFRRATGFSVQEIMKAAGESPDLDVMAAIVWLSRSQAGEDVAFDEVAKSITYSSELDFEDDPVEDDPDSPQP